VERIEGRIWPSAAASGGLSQRDGGGVGLRGQLTAQVLLQAGLAASPIGPESPRGYR